MKATLIAAVLAAALAAGALAIVAAEKQSQAEKNLSELYKATPNSDAALAARAKAKAALELAARFPELEAAYVGKSADAPARAAALARAKQKFPRAPYKVSDRLNLMAMVAAAEQARTNRPALVQGVRVEIDGGWGWVQCMPEQAERLAPHAWAALTNYDAVAFSNAMAIVGKRGAK